MALRYTKGGNFKTLEDRIRGGPVLTTRSRFLKQPAPFQTDVERSEYGPKRTPGGEQSKTEGETKLKSAREKSGRPVMREAQKIEQQEERGETKEQEKQEEEC